MAVARPGPNSGTAGTPWRCWMSGVGSPSGAAARLPLATGATPLSPRVWGRRRQQVDVPVRRERLQELGTVDVSDADRTNTIGVSQVCPRCGGAQPLPRPAPTPARPARRGGAGCRGQDPCPLQLPGARPGATAVPGARQGLSHPAQRLRSPSTSRVQPLAWPATASSLLRAPPPTPGQSGASCSLSCTPSSVSVSVQPKMVVARCYVHALWFHVSRSALWNCCDQFMWSSLGGLLGVRVSSGCVPVPSTPKTCGVLRVLMSTPLKRRRERDLCPAKDLCRLFLLTITLQALFRFNQRKPLFLARNLAE